MSLINYIKESKGELAHVTWPTRNQAIVYTVLVIVISVLTSFYLGAFDSFFTFIVKNFIVR